MRLALTLARRHGDEKFSVLNGPEIPLPVQIADFKALVELGGDGYAEVQVWESGSGVAKRKRFALPAEPERPPIVVPTLEEVLAAGYSEKAALAIVARQQAGADALAKNPNLTEAELLALEVSLPHTHTTPSDGQAGPRGEQPVQTPPVASPATHLAGATGEDLGAMKLEELRELADREGIDLGGRKLKAEIIEAIAAARRASVALDLDDAPTLRAPDEGVFPK